jgi:RNA polymerase sigma-54 factor
MALEIKQQLRQTQQLVMTPQLQQAIKLLQYGHLEMVTALEMELKENPILEIAPHEDSITETDAPDRNDLKALEDSVKEIEPPQPTVLDIDWENYLESYGADYSPSQRNHSERPPLEAMATYKENLFQNLLHQLRVSHIEGEDRFIALEIIGNIDENGYLDLDLSGVAQRLGVTLEDVEQVLQEVQNFEPLGIACRSLQECLIKQARALAPPDDLVLRILGETFDLFERGKLDSVARKLKVSLEEVKGAACVIASLNPKPGLLYTNTEPVYVVPDIFVIKVGNDYQILLNDDGLPRLRISSAYQKELHSKAGASDIKDYIQEKVRGAMWLIKSIHQRQRTIYRVTQSIIKFQREFFDKGIDYLRPLILKDIADDIEMHESTISRVTTNKYVHTSRGIFELKYFFNSGIRHGSESIASEAVKNLILRIVKGENPKRPVSDKQIVEELEKSRIQIARRTVAKYRELLGIPPSSKRKKKF